MAYEDLTGKQRIFVDAYIGAANCNATEAARTAGYAEPGQAGYRTLKNVQIREAIDQRMRELTLPPDEILFRLTAHARANLKDIADSNGRLPDSLEALTREQAAVIKRHTVKEGKDGTAVTVELHDAQSALLALAKRYDLFPDHTKHSGQVTIDAVLNAMPESLREGVRGELAALVREDRMPASNGKH